jgi:hypothetical protein
MSFDDSLSKCIIYFKDGNKRTFKSRDKSHNNAKHQNEDLGIRRLQRMIEVTFKGQYDTAIIYSLTSGEELIKYKDGVKI